MINHFDFIIAKMMHKATIKIIQFNDVAFVV